MAEEEIKCPLCDRKYKWHKAVIRHLRENHKDAPDLVELIKSVPKSPTRACRFCGKQRTNLYQHEKTCSSRMPAPEPNNEETNEEFVVRFRDNWLRRPCFNLSPNTVADYLRYVRKFIRQEVLYDPSFRAWHWTAPRREDFLSLREPGQYVTAEEGTSTVRNKGAAWKHLHSYIGEFLNNRYNDPQTQHARTDAAHRNLMKAVRQGTYNTPKTSGEQRRKAPKQRERIDPEVTRRVSRVWQNSKLRIAALARFAQGYPAYEPLGITNMTGVRAILALELLIRGKGVRLDAVKNITADAIKQARRTYEKCLYCGSLVDYLDHKKKCTLREKRLKATIPVEDLGGSWEDFDSGSNLGTRFRYVIPCTRHKTDQFGSIEHIVKPELLELLLWFCDNHEYDKEKDCGPFKRCTREQVLAMLARIMKKEDPTLWATANETGSFGHKAFRQLAVKDILLSGENMEKKLRAIGLTEKTARHVYDDDKFLSYVRAQEVMGPGPSGARPGPSGTQRPTRKAPKEQDSDPDSESESDSDSDREARVAASEKLARRLQMEEDSDGEFVNQPNQDRSPDLSDDDTLEDASRKRKKNGEDDEEATAKTVKHKGLGKKTKK